MTMLSVLGDVRSLQVFFNRGVNRCLTGMRNGMVATVAACVMFCGGVHVVATLGFSNPRCLCITVNVRHLVTGGCEIPRLLDVLNPPRTSENLLSSCKECQGS